jgi:phenylpropionate dioxygenase-like ring-hydroxylating dioxygenase large terminal subunit
MTPLIPPSSYCDAATFSAERDRVFLRSWLFAGTALDLPNHEDYRRIEVCGVSVILQNFHGEIKAFNNVCTHRFARIHAESAGNRPLKCPYHGWIYNAEGLPYAIPKKPMISEITPATLGDYRLSRWHVRTVGPLLFIKKEHPGETLGADDFDAQLSDYALPLAQLASACGELVEHTEYTVKANWKLVVENTLEGYHVDCVHPNTIRKLGMTGLTKKTAGTDTTQADDGAPPKGSFFDFAGRNSAVFSPIDPDVSARMDRTYKFLAGRPQKLDGYRHYYFFPNFVLASTRGESFSIQRVLPIDAETTQLTSFLFATNGLGELTKMETALKKQFYQSAAEFVQAIFAEDAAICEQVQLGVGIAHTAGVLSDEEERICAFHRAYREALNAPDGEAALSAGGGRAVSDFPACAAHHVCSRKMEAARPASSPDRAASPARPATFTPTH